MAWFVGKFELVSTENFDEYMKKDGVGFLLRNAAKLAKNTVIIEISGDVWRLKSLSTVRDSEIMFKLAEAFEEHTPDGRKVQVECKVMKSHTYID